MLFTSGQKLKMHRKKNRLRYTCFGWFVRVFSYMAVTRATRQNSSPRNTHTHTHGLKTLGENLHRERGTSGHIFTYSRHASCFSLPSTLRYAGLISEARKMNFNSGLYFTGSKGRDSARLYLWDRELETTRRGVRGWRQKEGGEGVEGEGDWEG